MNVTKLLGSSKFVKAADLEGKPRDLFISSFEEELVGHGEKAEKKGVVYFSDFDKALVCNATNLKTLIELFGAETDEWTGNPIQLYPSKTQFAGKDVACVRVRKSNLKPIEVSPF